MRKLITIFLTVLLFNTAHADSLTFSGEVTFENNNSYLINYHGGGGLLGSVGEPINGAINFNDLNLKVPLTQYQYMNPAYNYASASLSPTSLTLIDQYIGTITSGSGFTSTVSWYASGNQVSLGIQASTPLNVSGYSFTVNSGLGLGGVVPQGYNIYTATISQLLSVGTWNAFNYSELTVNNTNPLDIRPTVFLTGTLSPVNYIPAVVPVPAAVWLFGSALTGLIGFNRRKIV